MGRTCDPCTAVMRSPVDCLGPPSLMCAGSPRFCRRSAPGTAAAGTVLPVLLHPELLPVLPSQAVPLPFWGVSSPAIRASISLIVEMVLLGLLLVPSRVVFVFSLRPLGVPLRTCIVRVFLPSQLDTVETCKNCCSRKSVHGSAAAGISAAGSAA